MHYLALLERKPGGLDHARPLEKWELPSCFTVMRRRMETEPDGLGTREFIRTLRLLESCSISELAGAIEYALDIGIHDADSIQVIFRASTRITRRVVLARWPSSSQDNHGDRNQRFGLPDTAHGGRIMTKTETKSTPYW